MCSIFSQTVSPLGAVSVLLFSLAGVLLWLWTVWRWIFWSPLLHSLWWAQSFLCAELPAIAHAGPHASTARLCEIKWVSSRASCWQIHKLFSLASPKTLFLCCLCFAIFPAQTSLRNWFKGNDTVSLLQFLEKVIPEKCAGLDLVDDETKTLFRQILVAVKAANHFMRTMYHAALWLSVAERRTLIESGHRFIKAFQKCAEICYWNDLTRFKYQPKKHMFGEVLYEMELQERHNLPSPNPLCWATQQDEDFVGRICTFSKSVSIRTIHERTLGRYQVALAALLWHDFHDQYCGISYRPICNKYAWPMTRVPAVLSIFGSSREARAWDKKAWMKDLRVFW